MRAVGDKRWVVRKAAAGNRRLPVDLAKVLLKSSDGDLVAVLAANAALPERIRVAARLKAGL